MFKEFTIETTEQYHFIDITSRVRNIIIELGVSDGVVSIYTPHTTAAITINENADPDVVEDILMEVNKLIPYNDNYKHREGNSAAHIKSSLFGASETVILDNGKLILGTWQSLYFCEFDGPRLRKVFVKIIEG